MKTITFTSALVIACLIGASTLQAQHNENRRGSGARGNAYGHSGNTNQNRGNANGPNVNRGGGGNAYGNDKGYNRSNAGGNAYGHDKKDRNYNSGNRTNVHNNTTVINNNRTVVRGSSNHHPGMSRRNVIVTRPQRVHSVRVIDNSYTRYHHHNMDYHYRDGYYYRNVNGVYNRCAAPRGLRITVIPSHYYRVSVGGLPYYYYGGMYYRQIDRQYEVVAPPVGAIVPELPEYGVAEVTINGELYYEFDDVLYKPVVTRDGIQYRVVGNMDVNQYN